MAKQTWKYGSWSFDRIKTVQNISIKKNIKGLLSGGSVWVVMRTNQIKKLDSLCIGTIDGGREMARPLRELLNMSSKETRDIKTKKSAHEMPKKHSFKISQTRHKYASKYLTLILGAEEALFLVHTMKCLRVYKSSNKSDVWIQLSTGSYDMLHLVSAKELLNEFIMCHPRFLYRYLAYFNYRSKGWFVRSGLQFGSDFTLYQYHPKLVHSRFSVLVIPTAIKSNGKIKKRKVKNMEVKRHKFSGSNKIIDPKFLWSEIISLKRLQAKISKRLVFCYVSLIDRIDGLLYGNSIKYSSLSMKGSSKFSENIFDDHLCISSIIDRALIQEILIGR
eukprot:gnl/TRDRNA2_/TRDRNA2_177169_c0_seq1.p1 gnl/TRDRNA2_/TRDRNA2_177169_c0~~gnl/TRDRNA2_/TRDRNA2_177169_c0_seq1.p1  ORF type:complete len:333 (+),score=-17.94 gnl/TRDRNA2_/TRDRNA2_177169_c0_seq1:36-1034(+)